MELGLFGLYKHGNSTAEGDRSGSGLGVTGTQEQMSPFLPALLQCQQRHGFPDKFLPLRRPRDGSCHSQTVSGCIGDGRSGSGVFLRISVKYGKIQKVPGEGRASSFIENVYKRKVCVWV